MEEVTQDWIEDCSGWLYAMEQVVAEMNAIFKAHEERTMAIVKASLEEIKSIVEHQEAPEEEAAVRSFGPQGPESGCRVPP
jgi:hypothetical protein